MEPEYPGGKDRRALSASQSVIVFDARRSSVQGRRASQGIARNWAAGDWFEALEPRLLFAVAAAAIELDSAFGNGGVVQLSQPFSGDDPNQVERKLLAVGPN